MTMQPSKTQRLLLAGAVMLGTAVPQWAQAQQPGLMKVNDSVVAKHIGAGAQYALYDTKKGPACIGVYDAAAVTQGKEPLQPAGLSNAAEMQAILDNAPKMNGYPMIIKGLYDGPAVQTGDCNVGQATTNYAAGSSATSSPGALDVSY